MDTQSIINDPKNKKYMTIGIIALFILGFLLIVSSCHRTPSYSPSYASSQQPVVIHQDNSTATALTAGAIGAGAGYMGAKYLQNKQQQADARLKTQDVNNQNITNIQPVKALPKPPVSLVKPSTPTRSVSVRR